MEQSDFGSLSTTLEKKGKLYTCRKWIETAAILLGLIGGGTGLGYYFGIQQGAAVHLAEIDRLRDAYRDNLSAITQDVKSATSQLDDAVNTASRTAEKVAKQSTRVVTIVASSPKLATSAPTQVKPETVYPPATNPFTNGR